MYVPFPNVEFDPKLIRPDRTYQVTFQNVHRLYIYTLLLFSSFLPPLPFPFSRHESSTRSSYPITRSKLFTSLVTTAPEQTLSLSLSPSPLRR